MMIWAVNIEEPIDRTEFWRDMEACRRTHSPTAAAQFAYSLIHRQASIEMYYTHRFRLTEVEAQQFDALVRQLWHEAVARGDLNVTIMHIYPVITTQLGSAAPEKKR